MNYINSLERNRPLFLLIGLSISLSICFLAFEWKTYANNENKLLITIDHYIDTTELVSVAYIPQPKPFVPKIQLTKSKLIEPVDFEIFKEIEFIKKVNKFKDYNNNDFDDENTLEELDPLPFKNDIINPDIHPVFINGKCKAETSNKKQYLCSINEIREKIKNQLYRPDYITKDIEFSLNFKIDTLGTVTNIRVIGTNNVHIINSAQQILSGLPQFSPPFLNGEKRVMKSFINVKIKNE